MPSYRVYLQDVPPEFESQVVERLVKLAHRDEEAARELLTRKPALLARGLDQEAARRLREYLEEVGAVLRMEPEQEQVGAGAREAAEKQPAATPVRRVAGGGEDHEGADGAVPRPVSVLRRLAWGLEIFAATWGRQVLVLLALFLIVLTGQLVGAWFFAPDLAVMDTSDPAVAMRLLSSPGPLAFFFAIQVVGALASFWYQGALIRLGTLYMEEGKALRLRQVMGDALRRLPELITALGIVGLPLLLLAGGGALGAAYAFLPQQQFLPFAATMILIMVATMSLAVALALVSPVVVLETIGPWDAVVRAWHLSHGLRWRIFGTLSLVMLLFIVGSIVIQLLMALLTLGLGLLGGVGVVLGGLATVLLFFALLLLVLFLIPFCVTSFYFEARVRGEGWEPPWESVPDPSWPVSTASVAGPESRGVRAWLELLGYTVLFVGLLYLAFTLLAPRFASWMMANMPVPPGPSQTIRPNAMPGAGVAELPGASGQTAPAADGPPRLRIETGTFFGQGAHPNLWLKLDLSGLADLPEGMDTGRLLSIEIERVTSRDGRDLYNRDSPFEGKYHKQVPLRRQAPAGFSGIRNVYVLSGTSRDRIASVDGTATLREPLKMHTQLVAPGDAGRTLEIAPDLRVTVESMAADKIKLQLSGTSLKRRFQGVAGVAGDRIVAPNMWSSSTLNGSLSFNASFPGPVDAVHLFVAEDVREASIPFHVEMGQGAQLSFE